ncbi:hypothetical protein [Nocardia yamanashiensis]|uniref:hypothetical protein n=1 Tax=Nocardia yamanashiensis TaxID=209247 RepID=UPI000A8AAB23|nr:hypothetical protein [Nocardia yamanashiensis]
MTIHYTPMHMPLRLLIRNDADTAWQVCGCFDTFHELITHVRESKISRARKRIVEVAMTERREPGLHRYRFTTIWEGTRLPAGMGANSTVEDAEYPRDYDVTN